MAGLAPSSSSATARDELLQEEADEVWDKEVLFQQVASELRKILNKGAH